MKKKIAVIIILIIGISLIYVQNKPDIMFNIMAVSDNPSKLYFYSLERIYKLSQKEKVRDHILLKLNNKYNQLTNYYIHVLGVVGEKKASEHLILMYRNDKLKKSTKYSIIDSMGLISSNESVSFLQNLSTGNNKDEYAAQSFLVARALYLSSGRTIQYLNMSGEVSTFRPTDELKLARDIINASQNRDRNQEEMLMLDSLFRHPAWK